MTLCAVWEASSACFPSSCAVIWKQLKTEPGNHWGQDLHAHTGASNQPCRVFTPSFFSHLSDNLLHRDHQQELPVRGGVQVCDPVFMSLNSWWHESPVRLLQTPNLGHSYLSLCVFIMSVWMDAHILHFCMYRKQTTICNILLWAEPCMTTDLYISTLRRCPVAMTPREADASKAWWLASRSP